MNEEYIIYVADTETTGTIFEKHEIIEISLLRFVLNSKNEPEQKTWLMRATLPQNIEDQALAVNGHKREDIVGISKFGKENYLLPTDVLPQIENWIAEDDCLTSDRILAGHNIGFDFSMMEAQWNRHNAYDTFPFTTGPNKQLLDTKQLALYIDVLLGKRRKFYNLGEMVKAYGLKKEKAHKADADTRMTHQLLLKQTEPFIKTAKEVFSSFVSEE